MTTPADIDALIVHALAEARAIMARYVAGTLTPAQWRGEVASLIEDMHVEAAFIATGTRNVQQLSREQYEALVLRVREQTQYLDGFAADLPQMSDDAVTARLAMYTGAVRGTATAVEYAEWPIPYLPGQGTPCRGNCRCRVRLEVLDQATGDADVYWDVDGAAESCDECLARGARSPQRIRGGVLLGL